MKKEITIKALVSFISENYLIDEADIPLDRSLIDEGVIDSFGLIEIASHLQSEYQIEITEEELIRDNFGSILKMVEFVGNKKT